MVNLVRINSNICSGLILRYYQNFEYRDANNLRASLGMSLGYYLVVFSTHFSSVSCHSDQVLALRRSLGPHPAQGADCEDSDTETSSTN